MNAEMPPYPLIGLIAYTTRILTTVEYVSRSPLDTVLNHCHAIQTETGSPMVVACRCDDRGQRGCAHSLKRVGPVTDLCSPGGKLATAGNFLTSFLPSLRRSAR